MRNYIIFGAPGAGKGTQADLIAKKFGLIHLSSGAILRREISKGELGKKIKTCLDKGRLVPDTLIISLMEKQIKRDLKSGLVLDGYPRTLRQARSLDRLLKNKKTKIDAVLNLHLDQALALKRIILRGQTSGRSDDNAKTIKKRFAVYRLETAPLLDYYRQQKKLINIDGRPEISANFKNITSRL